MTIDPLRTCQKIVLKSKSSFTLCLLYVTPDQRNALTALYSFCREIDDIADDIQNIQIATQQLNFWHKEIENCYQGKSTHPIGTTLQPYIEQYKLPQTLFTQMIEGMQMDLHHKGYATLCELSDYCYHVASTVGLLACRIFGYRDPNTLQYAKTLGLALQHINIIRDVQEDANRNRVYLPEEILSQFNLRAQDIVKNRYSKTSLQQVLAHTASHATTLFEKALNTLPETDRVSQLPGLIIGNIYFQLLKKIKKNNYDVMTKRFSLSPLLKLWIAFHTAQTEKKRAKTLLKT